MTRFTLQGRRLPDAMVTITWEDGQLSGDADAVAMVRVLAEAYEGQTIVLTPGPSSRHDHLKNPWAARELMCMVFWGLPRQIAGSLPRLPDPPKGAIR